MLEDIEDMFLFVWKKFYFIEWALKTVATRENTVFAVHEFK
jgi:hypothetical protein